MLFFKLIANNDIIDYYFHFPRFVRQNHDDYFNLLHCCAGCVPGCFFFACLES